MDKEESNTEKLVTGGNKIKSRVQELNHLIDDSINKKDMQKAILHVDKLLELEPWQERAHRQRMWLYWQTEEIDKALEHYQKFTQQLEHEFNASPAEETKKLYEVLLEDKKNSFQELILLKNN